MERGRNGRKWVVGFGLCWAAIGLVACGSDTPAEEETGATTSIATTTSAATGPLLDGTYALSGTQVCDQVAGAEPTSSSLFDGSTLIVSGDRVTVRLSNEPLDASLATDGASFHINQVFDLSGDPVVSSGGSAPASTELVLDLTGTSADGGQTIEGTGYYMGVNCEYTFTGRWADGGAPEQQAVADPCTVMDLAGAVTEAWSHIDPSLGEVRVVSACAEPWALANFEQADTTLVRWDGSAWQVADPADYCASATEPVPASPPGEEDQAARILYSMCSPAAQPTTTTTIPPPVAGEGPCTRTAIQAALPADEFVAEDPHCEGEWAAAGVEFAEDAEQLYLFHWDGSAWQHASQPDACASGALGPWMNENICVHPGG